MAFLDNAGLEHFTQKICSKIAQADWNVNDESDPAYIRNRPFYSSDPVEVIVVDNIVIEAVGNVSIFTPDTAIVEGNEYTVTLNTDTYTVVCHEDSGGVYMGNYAFLGVDEDTGEPFFIADMGDGTYIIVVENDGSYTLSISGMVADINKIDSKYIDFPTTVGWLGEGPNAELFNDSNNVATGGYSHAEGCTNTASGGFSHAEGYIVTASGDYSHAEGKHTTASNMASHAEGIDTIASNQASHAEGVKTTASGGFSHAEGCGAVASGAYSHAEGNYTTAASSCQHVQGRHNVVDADDTYLHITGNGLNENVKSNAHTLDWDGNAWFSGSIYVGGSPTTSDGVADYSTASEVALKSDIAVITTAQIDAICV